MTNKPLRKTLRRVTHAGVKRVPEGAFKTIREAHEALRVHLGVEVLP